MGQHEVIVIILNGPTWGYSQYFKNGPTRAFMMLCTILHIVFHDAFNIVLQHYVIFEDFTQVFSNLETATQGLELDFIHIRKIQKILNGA